MIDRPPAVVIGLDCITGLQAARILARRGIPVIGLAADRRHYASRTRVCAKIVETDLRSAAFVDVLEQLAVTAAWEKAVLFPCTDLTVLLVSQHRERLLRSYHVLLPGHDVVRTLMDKISFTEHALEHGLAIPTTVILRSRGDAEQAAATLRYPGVLKPPIKTATWQRHTALKVFPVADADELLATYDRIHGWADVLVAQDWVEGGEDDLYSCNAYFDANSCPLVTFVARKLRQWPPQTGTSSLGEECRNDEVLAETLRLFQGVSFHGLAYLEMKRDARTGRHYIIEPNIGRPTGRSAIAEGGGVPLLYSAYCDALGLPLPPDRQQRYLGTKWIDLRRDLQAAAVGMRRGELSLYQWWRSVRGRKTHAVASASDPLPFVYEIGYALGQTVRGLAGRASRRQDRNQHPEDHSTLV